MRGVAVLLAAASTAAGCVKVAEFQYRDAGAGPDDAEIDAADPDGGGPSSYVSVERSGFNNEGARVTGPSYVMEFSDSGFHYPHQLQIGGQFLVGRGEACSDESGFGMAIYPSLVANGLTTGGDGLPLVIDLEGPLVARVLVQWDTTYDCQINDGMPSGQTYFTFFPDRRIHRLDILTHATETTASQCTGCNGAAASGFYATSFVTLQASAASLSGASLAALQNQGDEITRTSDEPLCLSERGQQIAMAWGTGNTRVRVADDSPTRTLAFIYDWVRNASMLQAMEFRANTVMRLASGSTCATEMNGLDAYIDDIPLGIGMGSDPVPIGAAFDDGIYGAPLGAYELAAPPPVTLTAPGAAIPAGFAVWLDFGRHYADFTITHNTNAFMRAPEYQRTSNTAVLFWFWEGLAPGDSITIGVP